MHCAAALLHNRSLHLVSRLDWNFNGFSLNFRVKDLQTLGVTETKILYTLHWILLYAAEECAESEEDLQKNPYSYLFSIPTISVRFYIKFLFLWLLNYRILPLQLFVYLFAPIAHHLKESDFQNFRLETGLKLWQGMWEYRAPQVACFTAPVKPRSRYFSANGSVNTQSEEVFSGKFFTVHFQEIYNDCRGVYFNLTSWK